MTDGLLLIHAFPLDATMWSPQIAAFERSLPVAAPNLPGFGDMSPAGPLASMDEGADVMAEDLASRGIDRAVACGLSMGGYVAFSFWRRHRDRVIGLVLANTRAGADDDAGKERRRTLAARLREEGNGFLVANPPPLLSANAPGELWARVKDMIEEQPAGSIGAASLAMADRVDSTADLAGIDVPTLVITSTGDTLIPPEASSPMAEQIPGARLEVIEGAGHLSNLEAPEDFNRLLHGFLVERGLIERSS
jgi:pimeloyl-ACP methyl ester carboxylesterase